MLDMALAIVVDSEIDDGNASSRFETAFDERVKTASLHSETEKTILVLVGPLVHCQSDS